MRILGQILIAFVGLQHVAFLYLEMFLWTSPIGLKIFRLTSAQAENSAALAANQGLYNGFLAAGLLISFFLGEREAFAFRIFFTSCVVVAGCYGAWTVSIRILLLQALPALFALLCAFFFLRPLAI